MRQHPSLEYTSHRQWPLPAQNWLWRLSWLDLLFIHRRVQSSSLRAHIPRQLSIDEYDGSAWISVVPFRMADMMPKNLPCIPMFRSFPELNVRTYVLYQDKPGVYFFSLDTNSLPLTLGARFLYGLPYYRARASIEERGGWFEYESVRRDKGRAIFSARYRADGDFLNVPPGSFEHWSAERYCLYSNKRGRLVRLEVHHEPWKLQSAQVEVREDTMCDVLGIPSDQGSIRCYFSEGVRVVSYGAEFLSTIER